MASIIKLWPDFVPLLSSYFHYLLPIGCRREEKFVIDVPLKMFSFSQFIVDVCIWKVQEQFSRSRPYIFYCSLVFCCKSGRSVPRHVTWLTLIVPRAWEIGYMQPCIKCQGKSTTHFVYFCSRKTLQYTHLETTPYIPQQGQSLHIWTTSLSTTGCYKNKYTIQFVWMACISRFATEILSGETELALGTIRVKGLQIALSWQC